MQDQIEQKYGSLLDQIRERWQEAGRQQRVQERGVRLGGAFLGACLFGLLLFLIPIRYDIFPILTGFCLGAMGGALLIPIPPDERQTVLLQDIREMEETEAAGPMIDRLKEIYQTGQVMERPLRFAIERQLGRLLQEMQPEQRAALGTGRWRFLCRNLRRLRCAPEALKALPADGSQKNLLDVALLLAGETPYGSPDGLRQSAYRCLQKLLPVTNFQQGLSVAGAAAEWMKMLEDILKGPAEEKALLAFLALPRLLVQLTPEQIRALPPQRRRLLWRSLLFNTVSVYDGQSQFYHTLIPARLGAGYRMAVLDTARRARDVEAIGAVSMLLEEWGVPEQSDVWRTANECLAELREAEAQHRVNRTLLRPSHPDCSPHTLLRAAQQNTGAPPEQLLRSVQGEEDHC